MRSWLKHRKYKGTNCGSKAYHDGWRIFWSLEGQMKHTIQTIDEESWSAVINGWTEPTMFDEEKKMVINH